jgi:hypothetical protein
MDNIDERFLRELAFLNRGNKNILSLVRAAYKALMNLRLELAKYEDAL